MTPEKGESELGLRRDAKYAPVSGCVQSTSARTKQLINGKDVASSESTMFEGGVDRIADRLREAVGEHKVTVDEDGVAVVTNTGSGLKAANEHEISWDHVLPTYVQNSDDESDANEQGEKPGAKKIGISPGRIGKNGKSPDKQGKNAKPPGTNTATVARKSGKASRC